MRTWALGLFILQLALNLAWSWIFFKRQALGAALAEVLVLWVAIGATTVVFSQVSLLPRVADGALLGLGELCFGAECGLLASESGSLRR